MKAFVDTNILLYEVDATNSPKRNAAIELLRTLDRDAVVSTQVLQEYYNLAVKKLGIPVEVAVRLTESYSKLEVVPSDRQFVMEAIMISIGSQISIWDALIIRAAEVSGCKVLYSGDKNHGQVIRGVKIINPFA